MTDLEFLVSFMKQNPTTMFAMGFFALSVTLFLVLEVISTLGLDTVASVVFAKIKTVPGLLRAQHWWIDNCIKSVVSVFNWVYIRVGNMLVGTASCIYLVVSSVGIFWDAVIAALVDVCNFPFVQTYKLVYEVWELAKLFFECLFGILCMVFVSAPIAFMEWNIGVFSSLFVEILCVFTAECAEQCKMLTRAFENAETYMRTQFCADKMEQLRRFMARCQTIVNAFLLSIFVVMCWWTLCLVHAAVFWASGCNMMLFVSGEAWHADTSLRAMLRSLLIVSKFIAAQLLKQLSPSTSSMMAHLKVVVGGFVESIESTTAKAIAPFVASNNANSIQVGATVLSADLSAYGIACYLLHGIKYFVIKCAVGVWFAVTSAIAYAAFAWNGMSSSAEALLTVSGSQ